jgi:thioredoxin reductase
MEAQLCVDDEVVVIGGGNSAGQAAVFLAQTAKRVHILVRSGGLAQTMSRYLVRRIEEHPKVELHPYTEVCALEGENSPGTATLAQQSHRRDGEPKYPACLHSGRRDRCDSMAQRLSRPG